MTVTCVGGDIRQLYLAQILLNHHYHVQIIGFTKDDWLSAFPSYLCSKNCEQPEFIETEQMACAISNSQIVLGPIPLSKDHKYITSTKGKSKILLSELLDCLSTSQYFIAGMIEESTSTLLKENKIGHYDYLTNTSFAHLNAIATAEGAISYAIEHSPINIHQSNVLILGYGTCGSIIAKKCKGLDAIVTVTGRRNETKSLALSNGFQYCDLAALGKEQSLSSFQYIFSTIPALILTKELLEQVSTECTIIDIASAPGSADYNYLKTKPVNATLYLGIPGKIAPKASAQILFDIIINRLQERSTLYVPQSL